MSHAELFGVWREAYHVCYLTESCVTQFIDDSVKLRVAADCEFGLELNINFSKLRCCPLMPNDSSVYLHQCQNLQSHWLYLRV